MNDVGQEADDPHLVAHVDGLPRHGRAHDRGPRRPQARAGVHLRADGRAQARRVRADAPLPRPRRRLEDAGESDDRCASDTKLDVQARAKYVHVSPRKARLVADHIRGRAVPEARTILAFIDARGRRTRSRRCCAAPSRTPSRTRICAGTATTSSIAAVFVDEGPTLKRWRARARGRVARSSSAPATSRSSSSSPTAAASASRGLHAETASARVAAAARRRARQDAARRRRRWPNGPESSSRRSARRRHPRLEVELDGRRQGVRGRAARGHQDPRAHHQEALARGAVGHPDPQGQAADHDRHLHRAPRHRDRQVRCRGRRAAQRSARAHQEERPHQHQRDQAPRARREARRPVDRRAAAEPRLVPARDEALARLARSAPAPPASRCSARAASAARR